MTLWSVHCGDCLEYVQTLPAASVDSIVTDPPYGLNFMGKDWDKALPDPLIWSELLRVAKPGAHLVAFGHPRLYHRLACAIEDAGWEIRDCLMWLYGTGFPKSLDVSKAIDKAAGAEWEVIGVKSYPREGTTPVTRLGKPDKYGEYKGGGQGSNLITSPATDAAHQWSGWGTALKPAWEPILLARKPLCSTVAANVLEHGVGGINIDGCRVDSVVLDSERRSSQPGEIGRHNLYGGFGGTREVNDSRHNATGRWPANLILDEEAAAALDAQTGERKAGGSVDGVQGFAGGLYDGGVCDHPFASYNDTGGASRFFYCAKVNRKEREAGLGTPKGERRNLHPTVKPIALMRWLVRLVTPPNGWVLDPFMGSGSTGVATVMEGFRFKGVELDSETIQVARHRIIHWRSQE